MIGATVLTHRQISIQEAIYRLGVFPLVRSTRATVSVSSRLPKNRTRILRPQSDIAELPESSTDIFQTGIIEYYQDRPDGEDWDSVSLATFGTQFNVLSKQTTSSQLKLKIMEKWLGKRRKPACLRISHLTQASGDEYYYSLLLLFKPFRTETDLVHEGETAKHAQSGNLDMNSSPYLAMARQIQNAIVRIRLQDTLTPIDISAQVAPNLSSLEGNDTTEQQEVDDRWLRTCASIITSTLSSDTHSPEQCTFATVHADESLAWQQVSLTTMSDEEYTHALQCASPDQRVVIDQIYSHNRSHILGSSPSQLLLFVTGGAGVGKSYLIRTIKEMLIRMNTTHNPALLSAPTGIAAHNIAGLTIHSSFCLPVEHHRTASYVPLKAEKLKLFRQKFAHIKYVIIDEISMVSCQNFALIHKRLCEIKDTTHDPSKLFGGLSIITFGDLFQLKPVHGSYIFDTRKPESYLWQKFDVALLTTNHRQAQDRTWAEILNRVRTGEPTDEDIQTLSECTLIDTSLPLFECALRVFPTRKQVKEYNEERLINHISISVLTPNEVYNIHAQDSVTSAPDYLSSEDIQQTKPTDETETAGLHETLSLAQGSRVMLIRNIYTDEGLVNGAQGTVQGIEQSDNSSTTSMPRGVYVKFDNPALVDHLETLQIMSTVRQS